MTGPRSTGRWRGVVAIPLVAGAVGMLAQRPDVLLLAALGVGFAAYPRLAPSAADPGLAVERTLEPDSPDEGDRVDVTVTVRNEGDRPLPDVRLVDGVPADLPVVDGTPRRATALAPGAETTLQYAVEAREGKHRFDPMTVLSRDVAGATERRASATEPTVLDCGAPVPTAVLRQLTRHRPGELATEDAGSGIEFHRTREYRPGDPLNRVDWRRFARTGELATVEFREERAGAVVVCLDVGTPRTPDSGSAPGAVSDGRSTRPEPDDRSTRPALARSVLAADRLAGALGAANHEVGLAALGDRSAWIAPSLGGGHLDRVRHALEVHPAFGSTTAASGATASGEKPSDDSVAGGNRGTGDRRGDDVDDGAAEEGSDVEDPSAGLPGVSRTLSDGGRADEDRTGVRARQVADLRARLDPGTQVTLVSPLADDGILGAVRSLEATGHPVVVVSPDATERGTVGTRLASVERSRRVRTLRRTGVPVVDWGASADLGTELAATAERIR